MKAVNDSPSALALADGSKPIRLAPASRKTAAPWTLNHAIRIVSARARGCTPLLLPQRLHSSPRLLRKWPCDTAMLCGFHARGVALKCPFGDALQDPDRSEHVEYDVKFPVLTRQHLTPETPAIGGEVILHTRHSDGAQVQPLQPSVRVGIAVPREAVIREIRERVAERR